MAPEKVPFFTARTNAAKILGLLHCAFGVLAVRFVLHSAFRAFAGDSCFSRCMPDPGQLLPRCIQDYSLARLVISFLA